MNTLVTPQLKTSSLTVAKHFGKPHHRVLRSIQNLELPQSFTDTNFGVSEYVDPTGRKLPEVMMTRDGFTVLAMGFTGKEAMQWKLKYLAAFNAMEAQLIKGKENIEWKAARLQITSARKSFTTTVKDFVDYATAQGSKNAKMYYANITKMEYQALELLEAQKTEMGNFRDTLDIEDLTNLHAAENVAKLALSHGMEKNMHYKEIYIFAKQKVTEYVNVISFGRIAK